MYSAIADMAISTSAVNNEAIVAQEYLEPA
jgi:hypothetical protein